MAQELDETGALQALRDARTVAVIGAHVRPEKPAHYVPAYLREQGYRVVAVNPAFVGQSLFDEPVRGTLAELGELGVAVDIVDVFRRSEDVGQHLDDMLAMKPPPRVVWLQQGIRNDQVAAALIAAGIDVVQDRCTLADHRRFQLPRVA